MRSKNLSNFFYKKKILITGHTGFTGSWISYILSTFGARLFGLSLREHNKYAPYNILNIKNKLKEEKLFDIRNFKKTRKISKCSRFFKIIIMSLNHS